MDRVLLGAGALAVGAYAVVRRLRLTGRLTCEEDAPSGCELPLLALDLAALLLLLVLVVGSGLLATSPLPRRPDPSVPLPGSDRAAWVALLAATLLMLGPLLLVEPIGPRNLYGPLVTLTGTAMLTLRPWVDGRGAPGTDVVPRREVVVVRAGLATVTAAGLVLVAVVAWSNARVFAERVDLLEEAVAERQTEVELPPYPHPGWVHGADDAKMGYHYYLERRYDIDLRFADR